MERRRKAWRGRMRNEDTITAGRHMARASNGTPPNGKKQIPKQGFAQTGRTASEENEHNAPFCPSPIDITFFHRHCEKQSARSAGTGAERGKVEQKEFVEKRIAGEQSEHTIGSQSQQRQQHANKQASGAHVQEAAQRQPATEQHNIMRKEKSPTKPG
jgi:hypothetical protein